MQSNVYEGAQFVLSSNLDIFRTPPSTSLGILNQQVYNVTSLIIFSCCHTSSQVGCDIGEVLDELDGLRACEVANKGPVAMFTLTDAIYIIM